MRAKANPVYRSLSLLTPLAFAATVSGLSAGVTATAPAKKTPAPSSPAIESEFHVGYSSDYVFRGSKAGFGEELYEFGFDFAGSTEALGGLAWSAGIWHASFEPVPKGGPKVNNQELNLYGEVSKSLTENISIAAGVTSYNYFGANAGTPDDVEPYVSIGVDLFGLSVGGTAYHDSSNTQSHDWYYEVSAAWEHRLCEGASLGLEALAGFFDTSKLPVTPDVDDFYVALTASVSIEVAEGVTLSPYITQTFAENDFTFGGVSLGFGF